MRVAVVVPVPCPRGASTRILLERTWASVEHVRAMGRAGADVRMFLAGPTDAVDTFDGLSVELVRLRTRQFVPLVRRALQWRPDVIHLFHLREPSALIAAAMSSTKVVAEYNGGTPSKKPWIRRATYEASRRLFALVFTAEAIAEPFFESRALSRETPLWTLPEISSRLPRIDDRELARCAFGSSSPLVLIAGRQEAPKDPAVALRAFRLIQRQHPAARLIWASWGGAPEHEVLRAIEDPRIDVLRIDDPTRLAKLYAAADVMIHASRREICGTVFMEALQQGCPIAATDIPAFRQNAAPRAVTLDEVGDAEGLARSALDLFDRPDARASARAHFDTELSFDAIARRRLELYEA